MIPLVDIPRTIRAVQKPVRTAIEDVLASGQYILGPNVQTLEKRLTDRLNVGDVVTVANGTDALVLALEAFEVGPGDEVITTPFSFFATAEAIARVGATPVFVDVDPRTYTIDPRHVASAVTSKTKAIIPVHLFGQPADMAPIMRIARQNNLRVIEDACQAFGATYKQKPVGALADAACFSFFPTKNLGTVGDGGCVTLADPERGERIRQLRHHGSVTKYYHRRIGYNSRLDEIHAAILLVLLKYVDAWNARRRKLAQRYRQKLAGIEGMRIRPEGKDVTHVYHLFCLEANRRDLLMEHLRRKQIGCGVYYPCPLHLQEAFSVLGYRPGDFPVAEHLADILLAIPMGPFLQEKEQDVVIETLRAWTKEGQA